MRLGKCLPATHAAAFTLRQILLSRLCTSSTNRCLPLGVAAQQKTGPPSNCLVVHSQDVPLKGKVRLDTFLAERLPDVSRAKVQTSIKQGRVAVNGKAQPKASAAVRAGDVITADIVPPPPMEAVPEAIPLDVVYEDDDLLVINKPAGMVMHISPGHHTGTLVNALLHHCRLPGIRLQPAASGSSGDGVEGAAAAVAAASYLDAVAAAATAASGSGVRSSISSATGQGAAAASAAGDAGAQTEAGSDEDDSEILDDEDDFVDDTAQGDPSTSGVSNSSSTDTVGSGSSSSSSSSSSQRVAASSVVIRPGIVHRLDKGTSGLVVAAKNERTQRHLAAQFKARTVGRTYLSITLGTPPSSSGRVATNIDRDPNDRLRMAACAYGSGRGRTAASNYQVLESLAGGGAALVAWRLETGRTHQIRVHARHIGNQLFGDDTYGGGATAAAHVVARGKPSLQPAVRAIATTLARPALHATSLAFDHPTSGKRMGWEIGPPQDFQDCLAALRSIVPAAADS